MAATGTTPSELLIDNNNIIRVKDIPNSITPETHSNLLDNIVNVLSANTFVDSVVLGGDVLTVTKNDGIDIIVTGFS